MDGYTYLDFAENDYNFFMHNYQDGVIANNMAAEAQNACEKYLKHLIEEYDDGTNTSGHFSHDRILKSHSLGNLINYIEEAMDISIPDQAKTDMLQISGYYFNTRYPGDDSFFATETDMDKCAKALDSCRDFVLETVHEKEEELKQFAQNVNSFIADDDWKR